MVRTTSIKDLELNQTPFFILFYKLYYTIIVPLFFFKFVEEFQTFLIVLIKKEVFKW